MEKKQDIVELTDIVDEEETPKKTEKENDLDKELEDLLGDEDISEEPVEKTEQDSSLEDELDALLEEEKTSDKSENGSQEEDIDIDSIFEKLDEDLNIDDEEEVSPEADEASQTSNKTVDQDDIDALFEETAEKTKESTDEPQEKDPLEEPLTSDEETKEEGISETIDSQLGEKEDEQIEDTKIQEDTKAADPQTQIIDQEFKNTIFDLKEKLITIEARFQEFEKGIQEKLDSIISTPSAEPVSELSEINNNIKELKQEIMDVNNELTKKIENISEKLEELLTKEKEVITSFFSDLEQELIKEIQRLVPAEAARVVREEIKAIEQELEEEEE